VFRKLFRYKITCTALNLFYHSLSLKYEETTNFWIEGSLKEEVGNLRRCVEVICNQF